jgi:SAM-dependent methyltransferase
MAVAAKENWYLNFDQQFWLLGAVGQDHYAQAMFVKKALRLRAGQTVLDAPCGRGRIGVHLAKAGCLVTSIDRNRTFLATARQRFRRSGVAGVFLRRDLRSLELKSTFHGVVNWFSSFGYFSDADNLAVLSQLAGAARRGGHVLLDIPNREFLLRHWKSRTITPKVVIYNRWHVATQRIESTWEPTRLLKGAKRSHVRMRLYTLGQMRRMFEQVGLRPQACYGRFTGEPYGPSTLRLILIGQKR